MANPQIYEDALKIFKDKYGLVDYDLYKDEMTDKQFTFVNDLEGSTPAQRYVRLAAAALTACFEAATDLKETGSSYLVGFDVTKFLHDFEKLAKARHESELEDGEVKERDSFEGATKDQLKKAFDERANTFNKPLPTLWKESLKAGYTKIENMKEVTNSLFTKLTNQDADKSNLNNELDNIVAAHEAMKQLRESRKGFFGFFWKLFNGDQNSREAEYLSTLESQIDTLRATYDVDIIAKNLTDTTVWGHSAIANKDLYRTQSASFTKENVVGELEIERDDKTATKEVTASADTSKKERGGLDTDMLNRDVNGKDSSAKSEIHIETKTITPPNLDVK